MKNLFYTSPKYLQNLKGLDSSASEIDGSVEKSEFVTLKRYNNIDWTKSRRGFLSGTSVNNSNITYEYNEEYIPVNEGDVVLLYFRQEKTPLTLRSVVLYDENKNVVLADIQNVYKATIPVGVSFIRICWFVIQSKYPYQDMQLSLDGNYHTYNDDNKYINEIGKESLKKLSGMKCLVYGDSMSDEDDWQQYLRVYSGITDIASIAIGGANIAISSTRNEITNPYDYRTDFSIGMTDTYNDRHLIPQIIHTPNTLRHKYGITSNPKYLNKSGEYIYSPDAVIFWIGFNDWKFATEYETYDEVKNLTISELQERISNNTITKKKIFTYLRYAFELLNAGKITETKDGLTYGIDCSLSKFYFITPIQTAFPAPTSFTIKDFGDYINEVLEDYSIERIDGYRKFGISSRYEVNGSGGKYLMDGVHPNKLGNNRIGKYLATTLENTLAY